MVSGRVQGVGFRWFVSRRAHRLGLRGWVTNLPDGRVEALAAGSRSAIEQFDAALRTGPGLARVETVEKLDVDPQAIDAKSFSVK